MAFSPPQCAVNMEQRLAALRRDQEIDGLRGYLIKYNLFPRNRDPENSPIRVEELKELVKHWKLHRQRGFWRDHPEKDDLVRALLQHIRSEAANKKRRQDAQDKYNRSHKGGGPNHHNGGLVVGSGEMSDAAKRDFSMILSGGKDTVADDGDWSGSSKSFLKNRMGGDLFYQRGSYDEGMIYLSRVDKSRFASEDHNPRDELLTTSATSPTPLGHLVQMGRSGQTQSVASAADKTIPAASSTMMMQLSHSHSPLGSSGSVQALNSAALTRDVKLKSIEGLYNVSCHRGFEAQILREGALATIVAMLKADDVAVRLLAAATLLNLTAVVPSAVGLYSPTRLAKNGSGLPAPPPPSAKELYGKMIDDGVLASLLELTHTSHPLVKAFCARALFRFTSDESHHFRMVHEGVVVALTQLLTAIPGDDDHRQACVHALVNLAAIPRAVTCDAVLVTLTVIAKNAVAALKAPPAMASIPGSPGKETESQIHKANVTLRDCGQALLNLSILPTTRSAMIEDGAMIALTVVASTRKLALCETVACVLCNCAAIRTNQEPMIKTNAPTLIAELLDLVTVSLEDVRQEEAHATESSPLAATARELLHRIRRYCVNAMAHFCCNAKLQTRVLSGNFVAKLLAIARLRECGPVDRETETLCIMSLANLALEDRCRTALVQDGAVPLLLGILNDPSTDNNNEDLTLLQLDCVTALSNLMLHPKNFVRMVDEGVVPALLAMVQHSPNAAIQRACVYAMLNMAKDPSMKTRLAQAIGSGESAPPGAIPTMVVYAAKQLTNAELCTVCVSFFEHLSTRHENYEILYYEGVVGLLVRVLQKKTTAEPPHVLYRLWRSALAALAQLATHADKRATFLDDGVLEAIQHVLSSTSTDSRRRDRRTDTQIVQLQFAASQIVFKLQDLCCGGPTKSDVPAFFSSLLLLATQSAAKNSRLERKAVQVQHKTVLRCALALARSATLSQRGRRRLATHPEFPPALNGIMRTGLHEPQVCAAVALCNLACERGTLKPCVWRDATTDDFIVVTLLRLNRDETKEVCAKALFNLLTHDDTRDQMLQDGVLYALLKLSGRLTDSEEVRDLALRSIYNISLVASTQQQRLLDMEIVRVLVKLYQPDFSKEMKRLLCGILSNLCSAPGHEHQIIAEGALGVIKHLAKVRDPETKVYAANILYNLSCCADVHDSLVRGSISSGDEGGAGGSESSAASTSTPNVLSLLVALLKSENRDVRRYAARTVANLSGNALAVQRMTEGDASSSGGSFVSVLNDVLSRTMASCLVTSAACVFALRNLLTVSINLQRFIDGNSVVTLAAILSCDKMASEQRTLEVATDLLCGLATFDDGAAGFEERLVRDGIVRALHAIAKGHDTSAKAATHIMASLSHLSRNPRCHELMLRDGVLDAVALLARTHHHNNDPRGSASAYKTLVAVKGEEFGHHAIVVLRNLAHQVDEDAGPSEALEIKGQRLSSQPAVVPIALALALSTSAETREHVVVVLHNLACHRRCRQQLLKHDGVKVLLRLGANETSSIKRHVCGLALQLLSKPSSDKGGDDPHLSIIQQDGIVVALTALAEPHHSDVLVLATKALHAIVDPKPLVVTNGKPSMHVEEAALLATGYAPIAQQGAPPDWAKVLIPNMAQWPDLEALAVAVNTGKDHDDEDGDGDDDDDSDEEQALLAVATTAASPKKTPKATSPTSPVNSRLRVPPRTPSSSSIMAPRVCSADTVLGELRLLQDDKLDKVRVNVEAELAALAQRRASSAVGGGGMNRGTSSDELPTLQTRPSSAPETDGADGSAMSTETKTVASKAQRRSTSTLSLARHDATAAASWSCARVSPQTSPYKSPSIASSMGSGSSTPKRKSRTLEPLTLSTSSSAPVL